MSPVATTFDTWADLLAIDPDLAEIDQLLARYRTACTSDNCWMLYARAKDQLSRRVGWVAWHAPLELQNQRAYDIGLEHIIDTLQI